MDSNNKSMEFISNLIIFNKYGGYRQNLKRRRTWQESVSELEQMQIDKYPHIGDEIRDNFKYVYDGTIMPSMRSVQFGKSCEFNNSKMYNCCYTPVDHPYAFAEIAFLSLAGAGVGYSVRKHHISKLPPIQQPHGTQKFIIADSCEGISDSFKALMYAYFKGKPLPTFEYRDIRPKGTLVKKTGSLAPGPKNTAEAHVKINKVLSQAIGRKLLPLEVLDIINYMVSSIVSGGIREAAMISLCDKDETDVITCKGIYDIVDSKICSTNSDGWIIKFKFVSQLMNTNNYEKSDSDGYYNVFITNKFGGYDLQQALNGKLPWYYVHPQRGKSNNSVNLVRGESSFIEFDKIVKQCESSHSGEPGIYWSNDAEGGTNPCKPLRSLILTDEGYITFEQALKYDSLNIISKDGRTLKATKPFRTGENKSVWKIQLANGQHLYGTANHEHKLADGRWKRIDELLVGDQLEYSINKLWDGFDEKIHNIHNKDYMYGISCGLSHNTMCYCGASRDFKIGFLRAVFSIDGDQTYSSKFNSHVTELNSNREEDLKIILNTINEFGIRGHIIDSSGGCYKLYIFGNQFKSIGFLSELKQGRLDKSHNNMPFEFDENSMTVVEIYPDDSIEDVYDITVDDESHSFVDTGITTHNCVEIGLRANQFCNLTTQNVYHVNSQRQLNEQSRAASFIGTLQAGWTDFHYLRPIWKETTEREALIGVSMTGIASGNVLDFDMTEAAQEVLSENSLISRKIGTNEAWRTTCIKPEGTTTWVMKILGSGVHGIHSKFILKSFRIKKNSPVYQYLVDNLPEQFIENEFNNEADGAVIYVPIMADVNDEKAIYRNEPMRGFLDRLKRISNEWIAPGHRKGIDKHNVSATVSVRDGEWDQLSKWMWENNEYYNGISMLPYSDHNYKQAPFQEITKKEYEEMVSYFPANLDFSEIREEFGNDLTNELACAGGQCNI